MNRILFFSFAILLAIGCKKKGNAPAEPQDVDCYEEKTCNYVHPMIVFSEDYNISDVDTIILKRYKYNDNFNTFIDSEMHGSKDMFTSQKNNGIYKVHEKTRISDRYDYIVTVPALDTSFYIHSSVIPKKTQTVECGTPGYASCFSYADSIKIDQTFVRGKLMYELGKSEKSFTNAELFQSFILIEK